MPIVASPPPAPALDALRRAAVPRRVRLPRRLAALAPAPPVSLTAAQEVFTARLDALADGRGLDAATDRTGWRMLVEHRGDVVAAAEVPVPAAGDRSTPRGQMNRGPYVRSTVTAITSAEQEDRVRTSDFALRLLRVPALHLTALWLRGADGDDVVVPLAPAPSPFEANRSYDAGEFAARAAELAGAARQRVDRAGDGDGSCFHGALYSTSSGSSR